jgi:hypothetical protein
MILLTHNMLASPMKEAGQQLPLGIEASEVGFLPPSSACPTPLAREKLRWSPEGPTARERVRAP